MKKIKKIVIVIVALIAIGVAGTLFFIKHKASNPTSIQNVPNNSVAVNPSNNEPAQTPEPPKAPEINFVGPRQNTAKDTPSDYGFWSFAVSVPDVLSRSGQPTIKDFEWLKDNGWKSVVDLRIDNDHGEQSDDAAIAGFNNLGFNYLKLQILDGGVPTDGQANQFLNFVSQKENQPAHVHCRGGYGRTGVMVALYRYTFQGWPMEKAIEESRLFNGGVSDSQSKWLLNWAKNHDAQSNTQL